MQCTHAESDGCHDAQSKVGVDGVDGYGWLVIICCLPYRGCDLEISYAQLASEASNSSGPSLLKQGVQAAVLPMYMYLENTTPTEPGACCDFFARARDMVSPLPPGRS